jgi:hypothetical protein
VAADTVVHQEAAWVMEAEEVHKLAAEVSDIGADTPFYYRIA